MFGKLFSAILAFTVVAATSAQEKKAPAIEEVPTPVSLAKAEKSIKEIFKAEYAKKKVADQVDLAKKMLAQALETNDDPPAKFVLLREARDLASKVGDVELALQAVDEMTKHFAVLPLEMKLAALDLAEKSSPTIAISKSVFEKTLSCVEEAVAGDDYEMAGKFLKIAQAAVGKTRILAHSTVLANRSREVENIRKEFEKVKKDLETLKQKPDDPDANLSGGKFLCFHKGDWKAGLACLANGSDTVFKALAKKDGDAPAEAPVRVELGDDWWTLGEEMNKAAQIQVRLRAVYWYKQAVGELTGLTKTRIEKRIAEMEKIVGTHGDTSPASTWTVLFRSADPSIWNKDVKKGRNSFAVNLSSAPEKMKYLKLTEAIKNRYVIVMLHSPGIFKGLRGWGFGSRHSLNDRQAWTWAGDEILAMVVFEISMKVTDLSTEEAKHLLKKKAK